MTNEESLGVQLIANLVHQLGGDFDLRQNGGTRWHITFPLAAEADDETVQSQLFFVRKE
jgi:two-component sensor histidine kinase